MSFLEFVRSHFACYLTGDRPDYASAVTESINALRPQVRRLQELVSAGKDPGCVRDPQTLCGLYGFVDFYARRFHLKTSTAQLEAVSEVLSDLFGPELASQMIELIERRIHDPAAASWIRDGMARAEHFERTGAALISELIDERLRALMPKGETVNA